MCLSNLHPKEVGTDGWDWLHVRSASGAAWAVCSRVSPTLLQRGRVSKESQLLEGWKRSLTMKQTCMRALFRGLRIHPSASINRMCMLPR